jgi:hypothetical protein
MHNYPTHSIRLAPRTSRSEAGVLSLGQRRVVRSNLVARNNDGDDVTLIKKQNITISFLRKLLALTLASLLLGNPLLVVYAEEVTAAAQEVQTEIVPVDTTLADTDITTISEGGAVISTGEQHIVTEETGDTAAMVSSEATSTAEQNVESSISAASTNATEAATTETAEETSASSTETVAASDTETVLQDQSKTDTTTNTANENNGTTTGADTVNVDMPGTTGDSAINNTSDVSAPKNILTAEQEREEVNDQNRFLFSKQQCIKMDEGFYCTTKTKTTTTNEVAVVTDKVYAEVDSQGDKEIALMKNGVKQMITDNQDDDDKPFYDPASGIVVWQTLLNDRYQIVSYNINTGERRQLTGTSYNNTSPYVYKNTVVWQGWLDNNWEIFMDTMSSSATSTSSETERITKNTWDDMFPQARDNMLTWQSFVDGKWQVLVYDITSETTTVVGEGDGGEYENPRFMLILDNKKDNGDVATIGYDSATGKVLPFGISHVPEIPQNVPASPSQEQNKAVPVEAGQIVKTQREGGAGSGDGGDGSDPNVVPEVPDAQTVSVASSTVAYATTSSDGVSPIVASSSGATTITGPDAAIQQATTTDSGQIILGLFGTTTTPVAEPLVLGVFASSTGDAL